MSSNLRVSDVRFLLALVLPGLTLLNLVRQPDTVAVGALVIWLAVAALDAWFPGADRSPAAGGPAPLLSWLLRLYVPLQFAILVAALAIVREGDWARVAGCAFAVGFVTGAQGITFAHELGHSRSKADRALGWLLMWSVNYTHFMVEHYRGHHPRAATHDDPATARRGESLWRFLPRTLWGSFMNAWRLEAAQLKQLRRGWASSPLLWAFVANVAFIAALGAFGEWKMLAFWIGQSAFAVWLLETVNYIEHYGLVRKRDASGRHEPFGMWHAWNANHVVSNSLLANLQRHSDHHTKAWKPFPELEALAGPQLPTGYAGCLLVAGVPPWWFSLMERRLAEPAAQP